MQRTESTTYEWEIESVCMHGARFGKSSYLCEWGERRRQHEHIRAYVQPLGEFQVGDVEAGADGLAFILSRGWDLAWHGREFGQVLAALGGEDREVVALVDDVCAQACEHVVVEATAGFPWSVDVFTSQL